MLLDRDLYKESFKCRICANIFYTPEELRIHRITAHKGHMLVIKR